jgi:hypothetical protein
MCIDLKVPHSSSVLPDLIAKIRQGWKCLEEFKCTNLLRPGVNHVSKKAYNIGYCIRLFNIGPMTFNPKTFARSNLIILAQGWEQPANQGILTEG